jgi:ribonuclease-3 family protein
MLNLFTSISAEKARTIGPVTLAFVGDAVYTLYIRQNIVLSSDRRPFELQKFSSAAVSAHGQNQILERIEGLFTEEEAAVFRRGRNAKKSTKSKNASVAEYNRSTGFEAVLGYLYLSGQYERISYLLGFNDSKEDIK